MLLRTIFLISGQSTDAEPAATSPRPIRQGPASPYESFTFDAMVALSSGLAACPTYEG